MAKAESVDFTHPDEVRTFEKGQVELVRIAGGTVGRVTLQPGWRWSLHVKPLAGTEWCEARHFQYHEKGMLHIVMADGTEIDAGPGQVTAVPARHDSWVVGNEPVVLIDWTGAGDFART